MSDETPEITANVPAEAEEAISLNDGTLVVDLAGLPAGSTVTLTVRVGPEPAPAPEAPQALRFMGQRPSINGAARP